MFKRLQNRKLMTIVVILTGMFLFMATHSMAAGHHMDQGQCMLKNLCGSCAVPLVSNGPEPDHFLPFSDFHQEKLFSISRLTVNSLYHPPK